MLQNHRFAPDRNRVAFAFGAARVRDAQGLAALPDGGTPKREIQCGAVVYCDPATGVSPVAWRVAQPAAFGDNLHVRLGH